MPQSKLLVRSPNILIDGAPLAVHRYDDILDLHVSQSVSVPSQLTVRFVDPAYELIDSTTFEIGKLIEVRFPDSTGTQTTVFKGDIVAIGSDQNANRPDSVELVVTALDRSHRFAHATRIRTFQNMTYTEVLRTIAGEEGLTLQSDNLPLKFDYLIQTTTNYAFLNEIAFRTGCTWSVDDELLVFGRRTESSPVTVTYGEDLHRFKTRYTALNEAAQVTVRSWDPQSKRAVTGQRPNTAVRNNNAVTGTAPLGTNGRQKAPTVGGAKAGEGRTTGALVANSSDEAQQLAEALATRFAAADLSARGECIGNPGIRAGGMIEIANAGMRLSGIYYLTAVDHTFGRNRDMTTTFTCGGLEPASIVDLLGRDGDVDGFGRVGLTIGIVTNNKDPDGLARVRVKFPALSETEESGWARVVSPGGGSQSGLLFMPQIGDEVLVGFEHGDLRRPFVLGGLWGPSARPPSGHETFLENNKVVEWGLRTAAGHRMAIRGGNAENEKYFEVALADGTTLHLGSDKVEVVNNRKSIALKSGSDTSVVITEQGDIKLTGTNITIEARGKVTLKGANIEAKATGMLTAEGTGTLDLKGGGSAKLEASGLTHVKGLPLKLN